MVKFTKADYKRLEDIAGRQVSCQPFLEDNPERKRNRIHLVKKEGWSSYRYFARTYFPHVVEYEFCTAHRYAFNIVEKNNGITAITGFRGFGKSANFGFIYPLWKIIQGEAYVIFGAANIDQAVEKTDFIRNEINNNIRLVGDFPELKIAEENGNTFYLANRCKIRATSIRQAIRGTINPKLSKRPGLIILDDIDDEENVGNPNIGKRKRDKIQQGIRGALGTNGKGKLLWLGNLTHPNFAICQFKQLIVDEIKADQDKVNDDILCLFGKEKRLIQIPVERKGKSLWEEQYPTHRLAKLKQEYGMIGYLREMMGKALIDGLIFKAHWFISGKIPADKEMKEVWLYCDPAWGEKGCYRSAIAIGFDGYHYYVLKAWVRQCENSKMYAYLHETYTELRNRFSVRLRAGFEANFKQDRHLTDFDTWARENKLPQISHFFKKINNHENKNLRIEQLEPVIESGKIIFPEGQDMPTLIGQFTSYPSGYIDGCDALAGCMERFNGYKPRRGVRVRGRAN